MVESKSTAEVQILNNPYEAYNTTEIPFDLKSSILVNYSFTNDLIVLKIAVAIDKNKDKFKIGKASRKLYYLYFVRIPSYRIKGCLITVLDLDFFNYIEEFYYRDGVFSLAWDNQFTQKLHLEVEANGIDWIPIEIGDADNDEFYYDKLKENHC